MPFTIRDFQPADFETLWHIDQECFPEGISYSRAELKAYMRRRGSFTLVAVSNQDDGGRDRDRHKKKEDGFIPDLGKDASAAGDLCQGVGGFIVAEAGSRSSGHIITIDVVSAARRLGVGSLLLEAAEGLLVSARCRTVELETAVDNLTALSFYKRHGYSVVETFPRYYSNGVDALVLQKSLPPPRR